MRNNRLQRLIEQVARDRGTPDALSREIADLALHHLRAGGGPAGRGPLRERDIARAVDDAWREWSSLLWTALDAMTAEPPAHSSRGG